MNRMLPALSVLLLAGLACGQAASPPPNPVGTKAAQTVEAAITSTPAALLTQPPAIVTQPPATSVVVSPANTVPPALNGVALVIPNGWAASAQSEIVPESSGLDLPAWDIHPSYTHITLQGYPLQGTFFQPEFFIYPTDQYGQMSAGAAQAINDLKSLLAAQGPLPDHMPFLPPLNAAQVFYSNAARISFQNGSGIRYLSQYDQAPLPVNNHEMFYTFQGLTQDQRYYVSAILPINAPFLGPDSNPGSPLPGGGVPFDWNNFENMPAYLQAVKQKLESTDPSQFTPSLSDLDGMVQSLRVTLP
jgi:hypothetical protein